MGARKGRRAREPRLLVRALTGSIEFQVAEDAEAAAKKVVDLFLKLNPRTIGLSGGSTPQRAYELLAESDFDWSGCDIFLVDERWVPDGDRQSNWLMIDRLLASKTGGRFHRPEIGSSPRESAEAYAKELKSYLPLDLVLLGLGEDGHTASLFPGGPELEASNLVTTSQGPRSERISMTMKCLNESRVAMFLVTGESKKEAVRQLLDGVDIPASRVSPTERLILVVDEAALPQDAP